MKQYIENLKRQAEANPLLAVGIVATLTIAVSKLMNANNERVNAKAWSKEVDRRVQLAKK